LSEVELSLCVEFLTQKYGEVAAHVRGAGDGEAGKAVIR
jgi:recombinational DNA repair protein (RecF pathway)